MSRDQKKQPWTIIPTANKFEVLTNVKDPSEATSSTSASIESDITLRNFEEKNQKTNQMKTQGPSKVRKRRPRIVLIGDSHARNCAMDLQHNLGGKYEVLGFAKPGAVMEEIVKTASKDIQTLSDNDVLIVWGGSNDISRNKSKEALNQLCKFVEGKNKVNLVIMKAPPRHDLMPSSCVNNEVLKFNRQMEKKMKTFHNVKLCDTNLDRPYFTNHGQHLNSSGKEAISNKLAIVIKDLCVKKQLTPICMPWKEILGETNPNHKTPGKLAPNIQTSNQSQSNDIGSLDTESSDQRNLKRLSTPLNPPKRQRKQVAAMNTDFLWT